MYFESEMISFFVCVSRGHFWSDQIHLVDNWPKKYPVEIKKVDSVLSNRKLWKNLLRLWNENEKCLFFYFQKIIYRIFFNFAKLIIKG